MFAGKAYKPLEPRYHGKLIHLLEKNTSKIFSLKYSHLCQFLAKLIETLQFYYYSCDKIDDEFRFLKNGIFISMSRWREKGLLY